jgi:transposase
VVPQVKEHRFHRLSCPHCGVTTRAWDEGMIDGSGYGERVAACVAVLSGQYRQSHRMVQELMPQGVTASPEGKRGNRQRRPITQKIG